MLALGFIAVHGGAGAHGTIHEKEVKQALRNACTAGLLALSVPVTTGVGSRLLPGETSLSMVDMAITVLENDERLNAGYGSNLTIDGSVECDASIMHSSGLFGSAGAVSSVKNPIKLARAILDYSRAPDKLGRVPPLTLVSSGAYKFAVGRVHTLNEDALIAPVALEQWKKWKRRLEASDEKESAGKDEGLHDIQDTVGAVAFHTTDGMAAGVSSGGLLLKHPGRVGEAAIYGAGCWATDTMSCSVSGTGEHIIRANLARKIGEALHTGTGEDEKDPHAVLNIALNEFWDSCDEQGEPSPSVGVILLIAEKDDMTVNSVRMWCAFTTPSMAVGYASTENTRPKAVIFRHPNPHDAGSGKPQIFITSLSL